MLKLAVLTAIVLLAGARFVPWLPPARGAVAFARALYSYRAGNGDLHRAPCRMSPSARRWRSARFLGGMVVGQSKVSDQAAADMLPMRNVFAILFFVSVGMLFRLPHLLDYAGAHAAA
jgi:CPA2 family monovalent cation:H+ antiporter-2